MSTGRWAWAEVDLGAIAANVRTMRELVEPSQVWAVVKANGYGHGAVETAATALGAGATGLCVALVHEGVQLREAGIDAPILVLSEQPPEQADEIVRFGLTPTVYSRSAIDALAVATSEHLAASMLGVHLKIDTGMHRVGAAPDDAVPLADAVAATHRLELAGVFTHLASADDPSASSNDEQLQCFDDVLHALAVAGHRPPIVHAANSAGALAIGASRRDVVRVGIAMYGIEPGPAVADLCAALRPAMSLHARVSMVKVVAAGAGVSYGLRHRFAEPTTVATVPIGYADGVPRRLFRVGGEVLIHGRRLPIVGAVTMDQLMIDCKDVAVDVGDEVVLIGAQVGRTGSDAIPAEEWAARLDTVGYEVVCGISRRIDRRLV